MILGDDERQAGDLGGEVPEFDAAEVGERNGRTAFAFAPALVDLRLDDAHFLVGDDEEVAGAAGGVEDADFRQTLAQVEELARVVAGFLQLAAQVVEEERVEDFRIFGTLV